MHGDILVIATEGFGMRENSVKSPPLPINSLDYFRLGSKVKKSLSNCDKTVCGELPHLRFG